MTTVTDPTGAAKVCASCGRSFAWRRALARSWTEVRYCSAACRRRRVSRVDRRLECAILELLEGRAAGASICPSEAARRVAMVGATDGAWRELMEPARRAARRLAQRGEVIITQRQRAVDPGTFRGPVRIRRVI